MLITDQEQINTFYQALLDRKQSFVGIFFVGVKTTSIFCIATCRARKPKLKNVAFYTTFKEALDNGYRPCKICKPTENAHEAPEQVEKAIALVKENLKEKEEGREDTEGRREGRKEGKIQSEGRKEGRKDTEGRKEGRKEGGNREGGKEGRW